MNDLPSTTLLLSDATGTAFGVLRLSPKPDAPSKGECIFDVRITDPAQETRNEVRWLLKRHFKTAGEHTFKIADDGTITVAQSKFRVVFEADEDGDMRSRPPAPRVKIAWQTGE
ncbi:MAG: hypothetical protein AB8H79_26815 [Myxococcota bacterium]